MRWVLFLLLFFPAFATSKLVIDKDYKEAAAEFIDEDKKQLLTELNLAACGEEADPDVPPSLQNPNCGDLIEKALDMGFSHLEIKEFIKKGDDINLAGLTRVILP